MLIINKKNKRVTEIWDGEIKMEVFTIKYLSKQLDVSETAIQEIRKRLGISWKITDPKQVNEIKNIVNKVSKHYGGIVTTRTINLYYEKYVNHRGGYYYA